MKHTKNIKYSALIRTFCVSATIANPEIKFRMSFVHPIKIDALVLEIKYLVYYRKTRNTLIYLEDEFGNTTTLNKLTENECKLIYNEIK